MEPEQTFDQEDQKEKNFEDQKVAQDRAAHFSGFSLSTEIGEDNRWPRNADQPARKAANTADRREAARAALQITQTRKSLQAA